MINPSYAMLLVGCLFLMQCQNAKDVPPTKPIPLKKLNALVIPQKPKPATTKKGKIHSKTKFKRVYTPTIPPEIQFPTIDAPLSIALQDHLDLLRRRKQPELQEVDGLSIHLDQLEKTIETLLYTRTYQPELLTDELKAYQLKGRDGRGNVYFTGYYTPIIEASRTQNESYPYPIYTRPDDWTGMLPTRSEIDGNGVLAGKGLELAYAKRLIDIYYMQVQGSGILEYPEGKQEYLSFTASNRHPYQSIEKKLIKNKDINIKDLSVKGIKQFFKTHPELEVPILFSNPSYVFFKKKRNRPHGAGHVPLTEGYSVAVDDRYIPLGSCLLAAIPVLDENGKFTHHDYQIVLAQDLGGVIKGSGRIDVYCGIGKKAQERAMQFHHYGQLWLLLPKEDWQKEPQLISLR